MSLTVRGSAQWHLPCTVGAATGAVRRRSSKGGEMRKTLLFCVAAAASAALASPVLAQSDQAPSSQSTTSTSSTSSSSTVTGTVVSSSDKQLVVETPTGRQTFTVVSGTSDVPTGLAAGTQVTVQYTTSGEERTVSRVTTSPGTSPYSSGSSSSSTSPSSGTGTYGSGTSGQYSSSSTGTSTDRGNDMGRHHRRAGTTDNDHDRDNLPATASPAFLVGLLGLLSLGGSTLLRTLRRLL